MRVIHYYPWGCFYPSSCGADTTAVRQLEYLRERGCQVECLIGWSSQSSSIVERFRSHYDWLDNITFLDVPPVRAFTFEWVLSAYCELKTSPDLQRALAVPPDLFFANYFFSAPMLDLLPTSSMRILETHDICTDQFLSQELAAENQEGTPPNPLNRARRDYLFRLETNLFNLYDATLMVQPEELRKVQAVKVRNAHYIPRMCPTERAPSARGHARHTYDILFVGSDHIPNREGINWFLKHVYEPFLSKRKIRMAIVGRVCDHVKFHSPYVELLGVVNGSPHALKDVYYDSKVVVVPILEGTGISIKTLEALAMGRAVVSTPIGARGLEDPSQALACVDMQRAPDVMAEEVLHLLSCDQARMALEEQAIDYMEKHHSRAAFFAAMDRMMHSIGLHPFAN